MEQFYVQVNKPPSQLRSTLRLAFTVALLLTLGACKKESQENQTVAENAISTTEVFDQQTSATSSQSNSSPSVTSSASAMRLTVQLLSKQVLLKGETVEYKMTVTKDGKPAPNVAVYIDDPLIKACIQKYTNNNGEAKYRYTISSSVQFNLHSYRIYLEKTPPVIFTLFVSDKKRGIELPGTKLNLRPSLEADFKNTMSFFVSNRLNTLGQKPEKSIEVLTSTFGRDVYREVMGNIPTGGIITIAVITCLGTAEFPVLGVYCTAFARESALIISKAVAKQFAKNMINSSNLKESVKKDCIKKIETGDLVMSLSTFSPGKGLILLNALDLGSSIWDFTKSEVVPDIQNGNFKGFYGTGIVKSGRNKGDMCVITFKKR